MSYYNAHTPKKIMLFGLPGSGKSTFAHKLHTHLQIPLHHLDKYFYKAGWKAGCRIEFRKMQEQLVQNPSWIIDGNGIDSLDVRYAQADIALYFRMPRLLCLWRLLKRRLHKNPAIHDRAPGCTEHIRLKLISYLWSFDTQVQHIVADLKKKYPHVIFIEIRSTKQLQELAKQHFKLQESPQTFSAQRMYQ